MTRRTSGLRLGFRPHPVKAAGLLPKIEPNRVRSTRAPSAARPRQPSSGTAPATFDSKRGDDADGQTRVRLFLAKHSATLFHSVSAARSASFIPPADSIDGPTAILLQTQTAGRVPPPPCHRNGATVRYLSHRNSSQPSACTCIAKHNCSTWNNLAAWNNPSWLDPRSRCLEGQSQLLHVEQFRGSQQSVSATRSISHGGEPQSTNRFLEIKRDRSTGRLLSDCEHCKKNHPGQSHCVPVPGRGIHGDLAQFHPLEKAHRAEAHK